jgi:alkanesulfonate monooxygenase SsuD/methylene tetrahydromethanopterin reductase-like flavin-dependent oxidoreductase (luciferase family)
MMCEQSRPDDLVRDVCRAEEAGFDFSVISDHFQPWLSSQGHSGYAWSILGAAAQATERIGLMSYVTCPTLRYHPAIVAQKAATVQILSGNRFRLGLGAGENLNEHVESATQSVTREDVADQLACGPDVEEHVEKIKPFIDAGYTEIALVQIGADQQQPFTEWAERELLPALRAL